MAKLKSNFFKSEYNMYDNPKQIKINSKSEKQILNLGAVLIVTI